MQVVANHTTSQTATGAPMSPGYPTRVEADCDINRELSEDSVISRAHSVPRERALYEPEPLRCSSVPRLRHEDVATHLYGYAEDMRRKQEERVRSENETLARMRGTKKLTARAQEDTIHRLADVNVRSNEEKRRELAQQVELKEKMEIEGSRYKHSRVKVPSTDQFYQSEAGARLAKYRAHRSKLLEEQKAAQEKRYEKDLQEMKKRKQVKLDRASLQQSVARLSSATAAPFHSVTVPDHTKEKSDENGVRLSRSQQVKSVDRLTKKPHWLTDQAKRMKEEAETKDLTFAPSINKYSQKLAERRRAAVREERKNRPDSKGADPPPPKQAWDESSMNGADTASSHTADGFSAPLSAGGRRDSLGRRGEKHSYCDECHKRLGLKPPDVIRSAEAQRALEKRLQDSQLAFNKEQAVRMQLDEEFTHFRREAAAELERERRLRTEAESVVNDFQRHVTAMRKHWRTEIAQRLDDIDAQLVAITSRRARAGIGEGHTGVEVTNHELKALRMEIDRVRVAAIDVGALATKETNMYNTIGRRTPSPQRVSSASPRRAAAKSSRHSPLSAGIERPQHSKQGSLSARRGMSPGPRRADVHTHAGNTRTPSAASAGGPLHTKTQDIVLPPDVTPVDVRVLASTELDTESVAVPTHAGPPETAPKSAASLGNGHAHASPVNGHGQHDHSKENGGPRNPVEAPIPRFVVGVPPSQSSGPTRSQSMVMSSRVKRAPPNRSQSATGIDL
eukprot:Rmarinus@m.13034